MIDKRLQYARQMYAMGQRVAKTLDGSRPGYRGSDYGDEARGTGAYSGGGGGGNTGGGDDGRPNMADIAGPVTGPPDMSHFGDTGDIVQADFTPYNQRPDTITSFMDNYKAQARSMGLKNAIPGAQIYNVGKTALETAKAREMLGLAPAVGPDFTNGGGDNQGIMNLYQPNMLDISGEVEDETIDIGDGEMEEFIQRFNVKDDFRQAKVLERLIQDQAIAEMISKLYT